MRKHPLQLPPRTKDHAMGRQHGETGILRRDDERQHAIGRRGFERVGTRRLVAMMTVGYVQRRIGKRETVNVGHDPETDAHTVELGGRIRLARRRCGNRVRQRTIVIGCQEEDRLDVGDGGTHERQAIGLRPGMRAFVRANAARVVALGSDGGEDAPARSLLA